MPVDAERLRSIMRGEFTAKNGVTGVAGVADVARYASKSPELRRLRPLRVKNAELENDVYGGVAEGVAAALPRPSFDPVALDAEAEMRNREAAGAGLTDRFCACGRLARMAWPGADGREVWRCDHCAGGAPG